VAKVCRVPPTKQLTTSFFLFAQAFSAVIYERGGVDETCHRGGPPTPTQCHTYLTHYLLLSQPLSY
jgi:hypothetical protein